LSKLLGDKPSLISVLTMAVGSNFFDLLFPLAFPGFVELGL